MWGSRIGILNEKALKVESHLTCSNIASVAGVNKCQGIEVDDI